MANILETARKLSAATDTDIFLYNGEIRREFDLKFIELVHEHKKNDNVLLCLTTRGGSPDAGYKMARYLQDKYKKFTVLVTGMCKSAGTLICVGASELVFTPYGELGPIDIQKRKVDSIFENQSGLVTTDSIDSLMDKAVMRHISTFYELLDATEAALSLETAAHLSAELTTGLFGPMIGGIDPYDVGENARSMRIAMDYGVRLDRVNRNMKENAVETLTKSYPSHGFVVDFQEAKGLFKEAREADPKEMELVDALGSLCRDQVQTKSPLIHYLSKPEDKKNVTQPAAANSRGSAGGDGQNTSGTTGAGKEPDEKHSGSDGSGKKPAKAKQKKKRISD